MTRQRVFGLFHINFILVLMVFMGACAPGTEEETEVATDCQESASLMVESDEDAEPCEEGTTGDTNTGDGGTGDTGTSSSGGSDDSGSSSGSDDASGTSGGSSSGTGGDDGGDVSVLEGLIGSGSGLYGWMSQSYTEERSDSAQDYHFESKKLILADYVPDDLWNSDDTYAYDLSSGKVYSSYFNSIVNYFEDDGTECGAKIAGSVKREFLKAAYGYGSFGGTSQRLMVEIKKDSSTNPAYVLHAYDGDNNYTNYTVKESDCEYEMDAGYDEDGNMIKCDILWSCKTSEYEYDQLITAQIGTFNEGCSSDDDDDQLCEVDAINVFVSNDTSLGGSHTDRAKIDIYSYEQITDWEFTFDGDVDCDSMGVLTQDSNSESFYSVGYDAESYLTASEWIQEYCE